MPARYSEMKRPYLGNQGGTAEKYFVPDDEDYFLNEEL